MAVENEGYTARIPLLVQLEKAAGVPLWSFPVFVIAATMLVAQGYPSTAFKDGYFQVAMLPIMVVMRVLEARLLKLKLSAMELAEELGVLFLLIVALMSYIFTVHDKLANTAVLFTYIVPIAIYFLVRRPDYSDDLLNKLILVYILFGAIPWINGLIAFYQTWGIPTWLTLAMARYDTVRMAHYGLVTFGTTGAPAAILSFFLPLCAFYLAYGNVSRRMRWVLGFILVVLVANAIIVQQRALVLAFLLMGLLMLFRFRPYWTVAGVALMSVLVTVLASMPGSARWLIDRLVLAATLNAEADDSVYGRLDSMRIGWRQMLENWQFGIGPNHSTTMNTWGAAHQYWINQGAEIGVLGFILWIFLFAVWMGRFLYLYFVNRDRGLRTILLAGPFFYCFYAATANAGTSSGAVDAWTGSIMFLLGLVSCVRGPAASEPGAKRAAARAQG